MTDVLDYTDEATTDQPPAIGPRAVPNGITPQQLAAIGSDVVRDWNMDRNSNKEWREAAEKAENVAAQVKGDATDYPWKGASQVKYPLLTIAAMAFHARAYPGIVKGDEAIKFKVLGKTTDAKTARAKRMADFLNWLLFYKVDGWEEDTDSLLLRLPIVGQHYRKVYHDPLTRKTVIESISGLRLTIPANAPSLKRSPRITHDFDRYPHELETLMRSGEYVQVTLTPEGEDAQKARLILEQHRLMDLDDDGLMEPYIVTVDKLTEQVLRIEEAWDEGGVKTDDAGVPLSIERWNPFVSYAFIPDMKGRAYAIGFGHLLTAIMDVVNTNINLMIDAGHAQVAGGGFISAEVRLQGRGQSSRLQFAPGEYKTVNASGDDIRKAIYERTFPGPSDVLFQLLGMLMEAAKDIASVNEAITGDSARTAPVGTTLALIEQGQQVFNAIYKRIYRALREEFRLFTDCTRKYGDPSEYARFCDVEQPEQMGHNGGPALSDPSAASPPSAAEAGGVAGPASAAPPTPSAGLMGQPMQAPPVDPEALFHEDFNADDLDVCPVSDPGAATRQQQIAKAQFVLGLVPTGQVNPKVAVKRALEAGGVDGIDELLNVPPPQPDPITVTMAGLQAEKLSADAKNATAQAGLNSAKAAEIMNENTGAQADAKMAASVAQTQRQQMEAFSMAAGLLGPKEPGAAE